MKIANNVKLYRNKKGLSQAKLARIIDISETHFQKIEYGETIPSILIALLLAQALQTTVEKLFPLDKLMENSKKEPPKLPSESSSRK